MILIDSCASNLEDDHDCGEDLRNARFANTFNTRTPTTACSKFWQELHGAISNASRLQEKQA
jgi:hypothetical protein